MYMGVWSRQGNALYVSLDDGLSWEKRSVIFPIDYPDFSKLSDAGPPFYPHIIFCPDLSMLAMTYHTHRPFTTVTPGAAWTTASRGGRSSKRQASICGRPRMRRFDEETLHHHRPRYEPQSHGSLVLQKQRRQLGATGSSSTKPEFGGSYAYTDSIRARDGGYLVFTSSPQSEGKGDIISVRLEIG